MQNTQALLVSISGVLFLLGLFLQGYVAEVESWVKAVCLLSIGFGGVLIVPKAMSSLRSHSLDMNILMVVATIGAIGIGEYLEASAVVFLFSLAEWLEDFSLERARHSIQALMKLVPETALLQMKNEEFSVVPIADVRGGQILRVKSGTRIPLDGVVKTGHSAVNQASITGEAFPVEKSVGDHVLAGTINGDGSLDIQVTKEYQETKIAQIASLIEQAQLQKAPTQRFVDLFAKYYTPSVFAFALGIFLFPPLFLGEDWRTWIYRALVLLVIACPCALVVSTPVSIVSGLAAMAKRGVLIKGGEGLESLGKLEALAVDKTGTITEGRPKILQIHSIQGTNSSANELLAIAASIDQHSNHPLAQSVVSEAKKWGVEIQNSVDYRSMAGLGAEAIINEHTYFVGNHKYAHDYAICSAELENRLKSLEDRGMSVVVVGHRPHHGCPGEVMGVFGLGDTIRSDAKKAIVRLHQAGIKCVMMLSGDNQRTVNAISKQVGIDEAFGDLLPEEKVLKIKDLKNRFSKIAMIGDGVNDAPAMATADLGIAMGASGSDTAIETSDITLMQDRLIGVVDAILMGKRTLRIIWFNTGFALATKLLFLGLSVSGHSSLWLAVAADTGATVLVIANALRLLR